MRKVLLVSALLLLVLAACQQKPRTAISPQARHDMALLPSESKAVFYCSVAEIGSSPLAEDIMSQMEKRMQEHLEHKDFEEFKTATGFDPRKDVRAILAGVAPSEKHHEEPCAIIRGSFDEKRIMDYVRSELAKENKPHSLVEEKVNGYTIYADSSKKHPAFCFAGNETIYFGDREWIATVLRGEDKTQLGLKPEFVAAIEKKVRFGDQLWFEFELEEGFGHENFAEELKQTFPKMEEVNSVVFSAQVDKGVAFEGQISCDQAETSKLLVDVLKGGLAAAKLRVSEDRSAVDALNSIKIDQRGEQTVIHGVLDQKFFDSLREHKLLFWASDFDKEI